MPYKIGGGNKLQWYNVKNGEYDELDTNYAAVSQESIKRLNNFINKLAIQSDVYFPNYQVHDKEYCKSFIEVFKNCIFKDPDSISLSKCKYLLTYNREKDKSMFLNSMGFYSDGALYFALSESVDFKNASFDKIDEYGIFISVETDLFSVDKTFTKKVDTIWLLDSNLRARFVTMIIGGKKYGNK